MKKYSKWISILMTMMLTGSLLVGCGNSAQEPAPQPEQTDAAAQEEPAAEGEAETVETETAGERPEVRVLIKWAESQI